MPEHYADRLVAACRAKGAPVVVGLDPVLERLPDELQPRGAALADACAALERFGQAVITAVAPLVPAVKINIGFFEPFYGAGVACCYRLIEFAHQHGLLVIADIKRGDIGSTAALYARGWAEPPRFADVSPAALPDAVTLAGYLGENAVRPFIDAAAEHGRGLYVLVRPSDPGADRVHEFGRGGACFYDHMAGLVSEWGSDATLRGAEGLSLVGAVVAPKDAASTAALRRALPHTPWLVPGYGAQGAGAAACRPCFLEKGGGALVNASRSVIYAYEQGGPDWRGAIADAAERFRDDIAAVAQPGAGGSAQASIVSPK